MTQFHVNLYAANRPHLVDTITVEAETIEEAAREAGKDPRVVHGTLYAHDARQVNAVEGVKAGDAVTLRSKETGFETWHRVQRVSVGRRGRWALYVGGLHVRYSSDEYEFVRIEKTARQTF